MILENTTKGAVRHLAGSTLRASRIRNSFVVFTITIATALLSALALIALGTGQEVKNQQTGTAQIVYIMADQSAAASLAERPEVEFVGEFMSGGIAKHGDTLLQVNYGDDAMLHSQRIEYSGNLPQAADEILVQPSFLRTLGLPEEVGQTVLLDLGDGTEHKYTVSGLLQVETGDIGKYMVIVSKAYVNTLDGDAPAPVDYYVGLQNPTSYTSDSARALAEEMARDVGIDVDSVIIRDSYFLTMKGSGSSGDLLFPLVVGLVVFIGAGIVMYSIFYISIAGRVREYGQLRTLGATKRQVKRIVYREGLLLAAIGIPVGLVIGSLIAWLLVPGGWYWPATLLVGVGVAFFSLLIVLASVSSPARKAAGIAPIEAIRYIAHQGGEGESKKLYRSASPCRLATMNLGRNKRRSVLVVLSLGISGVLLMMVASMSASYDGEAETRNQYPNGNFQVALNAYASFTDSSGNTYEGLQARDTLGQALQEEIRAIDGVVDVIPWYYTDVAYTLPQYGENKNTIKGFTPDLVVEMGDSLLEGTLDYDMLVREKGLVVVNAIASHWVGVLELGTEIPITFNRTDGTIVREIFTIMAIIEDYSYVGMSTNFTMPVGLMNAGMGVDCIGSLEVVTQPGTDTAVEAALHDLTDDNPDVILYTYREALNYYNGNQQGIYTAMYFIVIFIACFALINLVNTNITSFLARRQELGVLQAVGMSTRQVRRMLTTEGLIYTVLALVTTSTVGTGAGYLCVLWTQTSMNKYFFYQFPLVPVLIFSAMLLLVQVMLTVFTVRSMRKNSLVEQIREL